ncbi:hypothetical protein Indivirus_1_29 [Indivirus ILV1]|uniref:UBA domain-containing protein n=1 Tax=Indivirus ILV1 TaxID=1977633 RepID=A0A1V0SCG9_9VIRU|nr:hypothetical protein Indivirus_1_29 [Indivirus ILV1]
MKSIVSSKMKRGGSHGLSYDTFELKFKKDVSEQDREGYLKNIPDSLKNDQISYIDDLQGRKFWNGQDFADIDWLNCGKDNLEVPSDPNDDNDPKKFGDPTVYFGLASNKVIHEKILNAGLPLNRKTHNEYIDNDGKSTSSQGSYGIYGALSKGTAVGYLQDPGALFEFQFSNNLDDKLKVGLMPEAPIAHPARFKNVNDARDEVFDIILSNNTFKITPKSFKYDPNKKVWVSNIAKLVNKYKYINFNLTHEFCPSYELLDPSIDHEKLKQVMDETGGLVLKEKAVEALKQADGDVGRALDILYGLDGGSRKKYDNSNRYYMKYIKYKAKYLKLKSTLGH